MRLKQALILMATLGVLLFIPVSSVQAQGITPETPKWWEVAAGIISIPAAIIGIVYSYVLISKTRLEIRKTELDIAEKQQALEKLFPKEKSTVEELVRPVVKSQRIQSLIPRFIILYLIMYLWDLIQSGLQVVSLAIVTGLPVLLHKEISGNWMTIFLSVFSVLPGIARYIILFVLGWPLFKDANIIVGLDLKDLFTIKRAKS